MSDEIVFHVSYYFYCASLLIGTIACLFYAFSPSCNKLLKVHSVIPILILTVLAIIFLGNRALIGDSYMYAYGYRSGVGNEVYFGLASEWGWSLIAHICKLLHMTPEQWLFIITVGYVGFTFLACRILIWENPFLATIFYFTSFPFCAYGVNTLRSGFACALLLLAFCFWIENRWRVLAILLMFYAFSCHRSCAMPIAAFLAANYIVKKPSMAMIIWLVSLALTLVVGSYVSNYLVSLGFDARLGTYSVEKSSYYRAGFRWDFLLYGLAPIVLYWYVAVKRKIKDQKLDTIAITYVLSNAGWLQFIRMEYTDRFAYLSWFLMPLLLAYITIRVPIWPDQDRRMAGILALQILFSFVMCIIIG